MSRPQAQEWIDEELFQPLFNFLANDKPNFGELEELIRAKGYLKSRFATGMHKGFIWEAYVKQALARFSKTIALPLLPSRPPEGHIKGTKLYLTITGREI